MSSATSPHPCSFAEVGAHVAVVGSAPEYEQAVATATHAVDTATAIYGPSGPSPSMRTCLILATLTLRLRTA
jgi:hypothetical protein